MVLTKAIKVRKAIIECYFSNHRNISMTARELKVSRHRVRRTILRWNSSASLTDNTRSGRPRKLSRGLLKWIALRARRKSFRGMTRLRRRLRDEKGMIVCANTIANSLRRLSICPRILPRKPYISPLNRQKRLEWCRTMKDKDESYWSQVVFSDECCVRALPLLGRYRIVWRKKGSDNHPEDFIQSKQGGGARVMIWSCITYFGVGYLVRIDSTLDAALYKKIIRGELKKTLQYYRGAGLANPIFQQDNCSVHTAATVKNCLSSQPFDVLPWPSCSPDFSPIENMWKELKRRLQDFPVANNSEELWEQIQTVWQELEGEEGASLCRSLISSMPRRIAAVEKKKGFPTKY